MRYFHTIRYLRPVQIRYRIFYFLRKKWRRLTGFRYALATEPLAVVSLGFQEFIPAYATWQPAENRFRFLNVEQVFSEKTDWDCTTQGKLWQYNLHYFDCLHQPDLDPGDGLRLMLDFVEKLPDTPTALEPYPTSLRIINWVKFLSAHPSPLNPQPSLDKALYAQAHILADNLEYHLLGNHLLENGFALLFAACRYGDERLFRLAEKILCAELREQILPDGGHFERSPMYHQTILHRVLDAYNLLKNNAVPQLPGSLKLPGSLATTAARMLAWLHTMTFRNGDTARFNDTTRGIAPTTQQLEEYAQRLGILPAGPSLPAVRGSYDPERPPSDYYKFQSPDYELIADAGDIGPDYQPGHAHCDTLSFEMHIGGEPFLVNTGISTYEKDEHRQRERGTAAHNTVQIGDWEQSEIWAGFRVARRARAVVVASGHDFLEAAHTGYDWLGLRHVRRWECSETEVRILDVVVPRNVIPGEAPRNNIPRYSYRAHFHFHPDVHVLLENDRLVCGGNVLTFSGFSKIILEQYDYAEGFNLRRPATKAVVEFSEKLETWVLLAAGTDSVEVRLKVEPPLRH